MKIATYNVNGVNGRLDVLLRWLDEAKPDVIVLQELKAPDARFPAKAIEESGYGAVWHGQKSWNGVAILARAQEPHLTRKGLPGEPEDEQSRYIEAIPRGAWRTRNSGPRRGVAGQGPHQDLVAFLNALACHRNAPFTFWSRWMPV